MAVYKTVEEHDQKEKIIGGWMTLGQAAYIAVGFLIGMTGATVVLMISQSKILAGIMILPGLAIGAVFAFARIHGMSITQYYKVKKIFDQQIRKLPNCRPKYMKDVKDYTGNDFATLYEEQQIPTEGDSDYGELYKKVEVKRKLTSEERKHLGLLPDSNVNSTVWSQLKKSKDNPDAIPTQDDDSDLLD